MPPGEYICRRYARTMFRGASRTILFSSWRERRTANRLGDTDIRPFLEKEVAYQGPLEKGDLSMLCRPGEVRTTSQKRKCRLANHSNGNHGALPFLGPVPCLWVYISRTSPILSRLFHVERVFLDHLLFRLGWMHEHLVRRVAIARAQTPRQENTNADSNQRPKTIRFPLPLLLWLRLHFQ